MIKVIPPQSSGSFQTGIGTKILTGAGDEIENVTRAVVRFEPESVITAEITVVADLSDDDPIWAEPFMSEEAFLIAAKRYGYSVLKDESYGQSF